MPPLVQSCHLIAKSHPVQFVLALAPGMGASQVASYLKPEVPLHVVEDATYDALGAADVAIVSSGTATVEAALMDTPMIVVYRLPPLTSRTAARAVGTAAVVG